LRWRVGPSRGHSQRAQQVTKKYRIGILDNVSSALNAAEIDAFREGLRELDYIEGQGYLIEYRSAEGRNDGRQQEFEGSPPGYG